MPYVTAIERMAEARGKAEGEAKGKAEGKAEGEAEGRLLSKIETLFLTLETRFGEVAPDAAATIQAIDDEALLTRLQKKAILAATSEEFYEFLEMPGD